MPLPNFPVYHRILEFCHLVGRGFSARPSKKLVHKEMAKDELLYYTPDGNVRRKKDILLQNVKHSQCLNYLNKVTTLQEWKRVNTL